jgi:type III secretion protein T
MREIYTQYLTAIVMCAPRLMGMHMILPCFNQSVMPGRTRNGLAISLSLFLVPVIMAQGQAPPTPISFLGLAAKEFFLGFAFGFPMALVLFAAQAAGDIISFQSGASMSTFFDPTNKEDTTPMGSLVKHFAEMLFFLTGGYLVLLTSLFESYRLWPVASYYPHFNTAGPDLFIGLVGKYLSATCLYAFPAVACFFLITLSLGLISRYLPQLNVFFVAMPIQCLSAMFIMAVSLPVYAHIFTGRFGEVREGLELVARVLGHS